MIDFNLDAGSPIKNDEIALIIQQIDLLFDTFPTEVFGDPDFGTEYDRYLYQLKISNSALQQEVLSDLNSLDLFGYLPSVNVHLLEGTERDIVLIEITLTRDEEIYQKVYKIE